MNSEVYLALGEFYESRGIASKALVAYQTAVNLNLGDLRPQMMLADFYRKSNDSTSAGKVLTAAMGNQPGDPAPYISLANLLLQTQEFDRAYELYQQACDLDKSNLECVLGQGQVLLEQGDLDSAIEVFNSALEKSPAAREAFISLAQAYQLEDNNEQADLMYELALDSSLDKPNVYLSRADYNYQWGNFTSAENDYTSAREYWPGSVSVGLELARFYKQQNRLPLALEILENLADTFSLSCSIGIEMGDVYNLQMDWQNAAQLYQRVVESDPRCVDAYQGLAKSKESMGEEEGIISIYEDAVAAAADSPRGYTNLGNAYSNRMNFDKAEKAYHTALDIDPNNLGALLGLETATLVQFEGEQYPFLNLAEVQEGMSPEFLVTFALLYQDYNQWDKAYEYIERVMELDANNPELWLALGNHYAHLLDWSAAQGAYQVALHYFPDSLDILLALGEVQLELELVEEAKATFEKLVDYHPGKADGYLALAELYIDEELDESVVEILNLGIENAPSDSRVYEALGRYYVNKREFGEVEAVYAEGLENIPGAPNLYAAMGDYHSWGINGLVDDIQRAEATIWWYGYLVRRLEGIEGPGGGNQQQVIANRTSELTRLYQAAVLELNASQRELDNSQDDVETAKNAYGAALRLNPGNEGALLGMARLEEELGSSDAALEYYQRAVAANSNSVVALNRLGFAYIEYGDPESALPVFEKSISLDPDEVLSLVGRFRALIEIGEWGVIEGAKITDSAQFWWGNLVDRMRFPAFEGTSFNPNSGPQVKLDQGQAVSIEVDVPVTWETRQAFFDYSVVSTYTSPEEHALIQVVVFEDSKQVSRDLALLFALVLLDESYTEQMDVTANEILADRENLIWETEEGGYRGVTGFTVNNGSIVVMTYMFDEQFEAEYGDLLEDIANRVDLGDPVYP
jgi:tetratricopeptide (TPR) repeat protein